MEKLGSILFATVAFGCMLFTAGFIIYRWGIRQMMNEQEYEAKYKEIDEMIDTCTIGPATHDLILKELILLNNMRWKDRPKTICLTNKFWDTFEKDRANQLFNQQG
jgi:hypothetical protein